MSTKYGDRDYDRGQRDYGRRSDSDYDRSYRERFQGRSSYGRDDDEQDRYRRDSRSGEYGSSRYGRGRSGGGSEYGGGQRQYGGGQYGGGSQWRSRGEYRGREGYRPGSENDWDYTDDRESRYGNFVRGYDTGSYDDTSRRDTYDYGRRDEERSWLDRLADKLASWFGDEEAGRRYRMDDQRERPRGKGPKSYRRSDERIREDVNDQLSEGYLDASEIEVTVVDAVVTLSGTVNSRSDKRRAEDIADDVKGVRNVENRLRVEQSDIDQYRTLRGTSSSMGTTGTTSTTGTPGTTARGKTAGT